MTHPFFRLSFFIGLAASILALSTGCQEKCIKAPDLTFGTQEFTVTYVTPEDTNYIQRLYNLSNVQVTIDYTGGERVNGGFDERLRAGEAVNDQFQFGSFNFTERYIDSVTNLPLLTVYSRIVRHDYFIKKDTFGTDKLSVEFWIDNNECENTWRSVEYFLNDSLLEAYTDDQFANIIIVE